MACGPKHWEKGMLRLAAATDIWRALCLMPVPPVTVAGGPIVRWRICHISESAARNSARAIQVSSRSGPVDEISVIRVNLRQEGLRFSPCCRGGEQPSTSASKRSASLASCFSAISRGEILPLRPRRDFVAEIGMGVSAVDIKA